jgi:excisionase family DNA binding protein
MVDRLYSAEEAAALLGLQVRTVRGYIRDGRLRGVRIGKQYRITAADLDDFTGGSTLQQGSRSEAGDTRDRIAGGARTTPPAIADSGIFTLVDIEQVTLERLDVIQQTVRAAVGEGDHGDPDLGRGSVSYAHDPERAQLRLMVSGTLPYTIRILRLMQGLTEERRNLDTRVRPGYR